MHGRILTFFCILVSLKSSGQAELLHKYLDIQHQRLNFNGVVLVTKNAQPLYRISIGKASQELSVPMTPTAVFNIASISKQFTAMLIVMAIQEKKLRTDDSLALFFPELKDTQWRRINLHQLLSHTSGIPHNEGISDYWTLKSKLQLSKEQALTEIFGTKLLFTPGMDMKYSSPGYYLLASILEIVYKRAYADILTEKILQPLQMKHTGVYVTGKVISGMASGYHLVADTLMRAPYRDYSLMNGVVTFIPMRRISQNGTIAFPAIPDGVIVCKNCFLLFKHQKHLIMVMVGLSVPEKGLPGIMVVVLSDAQLCQPGIRKNKCLLLF